MGRERDRKIKLPEGKKKKLPYHMIEYVTHISELKIKRNVFKMAFWNKLVQSHMITKGPLKEKNKDILL